MMTEKEKILERVKKLLALATSSNEHEAAAAAAKAQELLLKHNLDESMLNDEEEESADFYSFVEKNYVGIRGVLLSYICQATMCVSVHTALGGSHKKYTIFGKKENLEVVEYLYWHLIRQINHLSPKPLGSRVSNSWRLGAVTTVGERLLKTITEFQEASDATMALVVVQTALAEKRRDDMFPKLGNGRSIGASDYSAYWKGRKDGDKIQINKGLSSSRTNAGGQSLLA